MKKIAVIADSTCDLSRELIEKYEVTILPLHIHLGDNEYLDGNNLTPEDIYKWSDVNKATPKTSTIALDDTIETMRKVLADAEEIIAFSISSEMSSSYNVLNMAAAELEAEDRVFVIDSESLSTGIGLLVLTACDLASQGLSGKEIAEKVNALRPYVRASFVVDTLIYLYRGGRCSGLAAMAGSTFKLHPCILVENAKMKPGKKYRGQLQKVVRDYAHDLEPELKKAIGNRVFITHSGCDDEIVNETKAYLESLNIFQEILITRAGGVISSHCGPGTLGVLFIRSEE